MNWNEILHNIVFPLVGIVGISFLFYFYFTKEKVRNAIDKGLQYVPVVATFAKSLIKDKKGQFDAHDALELLERVSQGIQATITDPRNVTFEDVESEVFDIVRKELAYYKNLPGAPDLDDPAIKVQVKVVFESIQRAMREDTAGNNS